jgi:hypothetical protein
MSMAPPGQDDHADEDAVAQAAQLRKDVATWSRARNDTPPRDPPTGPSPPIVRQPSPKPAARARNSKRAPPAAPPADAKSKPFRMSYDGSTTAEYIQYMIDRGAK